MAGDFLLRHVGEHDRIEQISGDVLDEPTSSSSLASVISFSMSLVAACLYLLCLAFLFGSAFFVLSRSPFLPLNRSYAVLALSLLAWVGTLFVFYAQTQNPALLLWGRLNFAAVALVAPAVYSFVCAIGRKPVRLAGWIWTGAILIVVISLVTDLVDKSETVRASGEHVTTYGPLFVLYVLFILAFLIAALLIAFKPSASLSRLTKSQLRLIGIGILATGLIGIVTNAVLPYVFGNFWFINVGTLSTICFLAAVSYATVFLHLFDVQVILRATLVFGVLIAFALELYQLSVEFLTHLLPVGDPTQQHLAAATVALIINAFTHDPLQRWLQRLADQLLKGKARHSRQVS